MPLRAASLCGERKVLWRVCDTVPEAGIKMKNRIQKKIIADFVMNMKLRNIPFSPPEQLWFMVHD